MSDPLEIFTAKPVKCDRSVGSNDFLVYYREDLPGEIAIPNGLTHHLITLFLTDNQRQVTHFDSHGEYDGRMNRGEFYLCPAAASGFTSWATADETLHLFIQPELLRTVARETECLTPEKVELRPVLKERDFQLEQLARLLFLEIDNNNIGGRLYQESLQQALIVHLLRRYSVFKPVFPKYEGGLAPYKLRQTIGYIEANLDDDLSLKKLAEEIDMSRSYFANLFKQATGIPPHQYVNQQRIAKAKQLLTEGKAIAEVALECGFSSQSHLNKVFRKYVGTTPRKYREQL